MNHVWLMKWIALIQLWNYSLNLTRSARMEETSMNEVKSINQYLKLISIEQIGMNKIDRQYIDLEYLIITNIPYYSYFPISLNEDNRNSNLQNQWMLNLGNLHSVISNHFIITSHYQRTGIITYSFQCFKTECNGL